MVFYFLLLIKVKINKSIESSTVDFLLNEKTVFSLIVVRCRNWLHIWYTDLNRLLFPNIKNSFNFEMFLKHWFTFILLLPLAKNSSTAYNRIQKSQKLFVQTQLHLAMANILSMGNRPCFQNTPTKIQAQRRLTKQLVSSCKNSAKQFHIYTHFCPKIAIQAHSMNIN